MLYLGLVSNSNLITTADLAARLGVSPRQVARLVRDGKIEPEKSLPGVRGAFLFDATAHDVVAEIKARQ